MANNQSANLDFLRAYAVLTVYFGHLLFTFQVRRLAGVIRVNDFAQAGVLLFFVHTSLVLMHSLERLEFGGWRLFLTFYVRRFFRIYPLSIATILLMLAASVPGFPIGEFHWPGWRFLFYNLTLTQNLVNLPSYPAVLWSLPYEVQMYLALPVICLFLRKFTAWWVPVWLWLANLAVVALVSRLHLAAIASLLWFTPCFLAGVIAYGLWPHARRRINLWWLPVVLTACVALKLAAAASSNSRADRVAGWCACLAIGFAIPQFRELGTGWVRRLAGLIARYSYSIYLSHSTVFWIAFIALKHSSGWIKWGTCSVLSVLLPLALFHGIEQPMIRLGRRLTRKGAREHDATQRAQASTFLST